MKYKLEVLNNGEIITDEQVSMEENCWEYYFCRHPKEGYGVVASSREICVKKINKIFKDKIKEREKNLEKLKKIVTKFEKQLEMMKEGIK